MDVQVRDAFWQNIVHNKAYLQQNRLKIVQNKLEPRERGSWWTIDRTNQNNDFLKTAMTTSRQGGDC